MSKKFSVDKTLLDHANYVTCLPSGIFVAAFLQRILIGYTETNEDGQTVFAKKTVIIPSESFFDFVQTIKKGYQALKNGSEEKFEDLIYSHKGIHFLVSKHQMWQEKWGLSLFYKWKWDADKYFLDQVSQGLREPVNTSNLDDDNYLPTKRGVFNLQLEDIQNLANQLETILYHTMLDMDRKSMATFIQLVRQCK